jgi:hypothetical protein
MALLHSASENCKIYVNLEYNSNGFGLMTQRHEG